MPSQFAASGIGLLLLLAVLGVFAARRRYGTTFVYGACSLVCLALALIALVSLLNGSPAAGVLTLPVGLPLGRTQLALDPLSAAFAVILNLTSAIVSFGAIGYGAHAREPARVVPFYPAFIAGMNLVLVAQDAFSFLVGWEFMSLASWALVVSEDKRESNRRAGLVYVIMAAGGALTLLFVFGLLAGTDGGYSFARDAQDRRVWSGRDRPSARADRRRVQSGPRAAARVAAARAPGCAEPCLGADERRHDQGRRVRFRAHRV